MVTSGRCVRSSRSLRSAGRTSAGSRAACRAAFVLHSNGSACLRSAISISMPGSVALPSTSLTRAIASRCALGGSTISTTTTCPGCARPRSPGGIIRSWLIRRFSASTNQTPRSSWMRPTTSRLARDSTSTISPSGRPRRSKPTRLADARSPCSTLCISRDDRYRSSPPASGTRKPKPSGCP